MYTPHVHPYIHLTHLYTPIMHLYNLFMIQTLTNLEQQLLLDRESGAVPEDKQVKNLYNIIYNIQCGENICTGINR